MNNATRLQYLEAMGIEVWHSRNNDRIKSPEFTNTTQDDEKIKKPAEQISKHWSDLKQQVTHCTKCELCNSKSQRILGAGDINADWMLIEEAAEENEDPERKALNDNASKLLTEMLLALGLSRESVYITPIVKCIPPNNRDPKKEEVNHCQHFLQQQIALVKPKIILAIGRISAQALLETSEPLSKLRGIEHQLADIPLIVVYHPAYLLRSLLKKRNAWQDLQLANNIYQKIK